MVLEREVEGRLEGRERLRGGLRARRPIRGGLSARRGGGSTRTGRG